MSASWPDSPRIRALCALYGGAWTRPSTSLPRVVVVGAGLAGLVAARVSSLGGCDTRVFDAAHRIGGRVRTDQGALVPGLVTELGGEFIDSDHIDIIALARTFATTPIDTAAPSESTLRGALRFDGRLRSDHDVQAALKHVALRLAADAGSVSTRVGRDRHSPTDLAFDRISIDAYLDRLDLEAWVKRRIALGYTSLEGLDSSEQSSLNLLRQIRVHDDLEVDVFGASDERWKVAEGLDELVRRLAATLPQPIHFEHELLRLRRIGPSLALDFGTPGATRSVTADAIVLALPFTMLRRVDTTGALSARKRAAIDRLAYGTNAKLIVATTTRIWRTQGFDGDLATDEEAASGWDSSRLRGGEAGAYTFFLGGRAGSRLGEDSAESQAARLGRSASLVWPGFEEAMGHAPLRVHWPTEPWIKASYSTYGVGQQTEIGGDEATPEGGIHFAGEHCSARWQGYMQGAASTGRQAALAILRRARATTRP